MNYYFSALLCGVLSASIHLGAASTISSYSADNLYHIGNQHRLEGNYKKALAYFKLAVNKDPNHQDAQRELAFAHVACENYVRGFDILHTYVTNQTHFDNEWTGQDLHGKKILVYSPAWGMGDIIMFSRYLKCLKDRGAHVGIVVPEKLHRLFTFNLHADSITIDNLTIEIEADALYLPITLKKDIPGYDYSVQLLSLPKLCNIKKSHLACEPYFEVNKSLVCEYADKLSLDTGLKIGICWKSADRFDLQLQQRSMDLSMLAPLLKHPGVSVYNLQMGKACEEIKDVPEACMMHLFGETFDRSRGSFIDSAALMKNLDCVVTVDTSVAHLAGALGVKTLLMLPHAADWRWGMKGSTSVWYPSMTLFRQPTAGDWNSVVTEVMKEIERMCAR